MDPGQMGSRQIGPGQMDSDKYGSQTSQTNGSPTNESLQMSPRQMGSRKMDTGQKGPGKKRVLVQMGYGQMALVKWVLGQMGFQDKMWSRTNGSRDKWYYNNIFKFEHVFERFNGEQTTIHVIVI